MIKEFLENSKYAVILGENITFYPQKVTLDCSFAVEIAVYNEILFRLSGKICPNLEEVETERAIYQGVNGGIIYSLCADFDR